MIPLSVLFCKMEDTLYRNLFYFTTGYSYSFHHNYFFSGPCLSAATNLGSKLTEVLWAPGQRAVEEFTSVKMRSMGMVRKLPSWRRGGALRVVTVPPRRGDEPPPPQTMSSYELKESESFESGHCTTTRGNHSFTKLKESERPGSGYWTTTLKGKNNIHHVDTK